MVETTLYTSTVGQSLQANVRNYVSSLADGQGIIRDPSSADIVVAVTESVEAMVDDILQSFASAALTQPGAFQQDDVLFTAVGVTIGEYPFIIALLVYQFLALICVVVALMLSNFWLATPVFDYRDVVAISTAAHLGASPRHSELWSGLRDWRGESDHASLGRVSARYQDGQLREPTTVQIVLLEDLRDIDVSKGHAEDAGTTHRWNIPWRRRVMQLDNRLT